MSSNKPSYNWIDITEDFEKCSKELKLGELVHDELFGLYDAMSAIELMDPKMDAGMMCNKHKKIYSFEEMIDKNLIKIDSFTAEELIGLIDDTYSCLVTWLNGHSLVQTVFINLFLHNPNLICDKTLKSFSIVILKIVDLINDFVHQASVYEEEDFQPKTYEFDLAYSISNSKALTMLKTVEDDLKIQIKQIETSKDNSKNLKSLNLLKALLVRIRFTKTFYSCLYNFKKQVLTIQNAVPLKEFVLNISNQLNDCESFINDWLETINYGIKPADQTNFTVDHNKPDYPTIIGFEPLINQRLLPPSFPRYIKIKPRSETVNYLEILLSRIRKLLKVSELDKFVDVVKFFNDFSKLTPSCVVSRSMLQLFYMPQSNLVFGEFEFIKIVKESCKQFIKPPVLSGKITLDTNTKEIVEAFFNRCQIPFKNFIQTYGHNRASQRGKIAIVLKDFVCIMEECVTLDQYISNKINYSLCGYLQFWILFFKFYLMSQYLLSGFELELYSLHEYCYMFFELDYIWDCITLILKRATEVYLQHELYLNNSASNTNNSNKNRKKQTKSKNKHRSNLHEESILYYKGISQMAGALHRIIMAFCIEGKIAQPTQSLNTERIRYNHRFMPLLQFEGSLQSYNKYEKRLNHFASSKDTNQLYVEASQLFTQARNQFETIKDSSLQEEIQAYIKVAKTNIVVLNLLLSGHNIHAKPDLIFTETPYFPIIKFYKK